MKAFRPTGGESLVSLADVAPPEPRPGEALVAVEAFSPNRGEILLLAAGRMEPPGKDVAGHVVGAAADGSGPPAGARVVAHVDQGGWAELVAVPTSRLASLPDDVPTSIAAALPLAGLTAVRLLRAADGGAGGTVLLTGASGGVGHYFTEMAAAVGAKVTAIVRTAGRGERLLALGASQVLTSVDQAEGPFDIALESVGGETFGQALARVGRDGLVLWYGQGGGQPAVADFLGLVNGPIRVTIRNLFYWTQADRDGADLATLVDLVVGGRLHPEIGSVADWQRTPETLASLRDRGVRGNAVLTLGM